MRRLARIILAASVLAVFPSALFAASESVKAEARYYADAYADHYGVPRELVHAIITHESGWNPRVVSNKGAMGLMQLMPGTAAGNSLSPYQCGFTLGAALVQSFRSSQIV